MEEFQSYLPEKSSYKDISFKAVFLGAIFGVIFGAANAYLGLRVGLTISTSIPLAVISVAVFKALTPLLGKSNILDANIAQTTGSASSSLASGIIFTVPALFLWGFNPGIFKIGTLALCGGILGVLFMIPLRKFLIVQAHGELPYPEGTATAQVLIAADQGGAKAKNVFIGMGIGAALKLIIEVVKLWPDKIYMNLPVLKKAKLGMEPTPALLGVGFILGPRIGGIMVAGGLLSWIGIIPLISYFGENLNLPLFPEQTLPIAEMTAHQIWSRYVKLIGAGAVAVGGIITVFKSFPTMYNSLKIGIKEFTQKKADFVGETDRRQSDLPFKIIIIGVVIVIGILVLAAGVLGFETSLLIRLIASVCIVFFSFIFVTVSSRIVGLVGVTSNPTSGMTIVALLGTSVLFLALGWTDQIGMATALTCGTVVAVAASIAGDTSQDLKAGYIIGAAPRQQQISELIGVVTTAFAIAAAVWLLGEAFTFGSATIPAPQAQLMKTVIEGVLGGDLPWGLVLIGGVFAIMAEMLGIPSLPFAVGIYLPLSTMTPIYIGGMIRHFVTKKAKDDEKRKSEVKEKGILLSSGFIAGEGLAMVVVAAYAYKKKIIPPGFGLDLGGFASLAAFILLAGFLVYKTRK